MGWVGSSSTYNWGEPRYFRFVAGTRAYHSNQQVTWLYMILYLYINTYPVKSYRTPIPLPSINQPSDSKGSSKTWKHVFTSYKCSFHLQCSWIFLGFSHILGGFSWMFQDFLMVVPYSLTVFRNSQLHFLGKKNHQAKPGWADGRRRLWSWRSGQRQETMEIFMEITRYDMDNMG